MIGTTQGQRRRTWRHVAERACAAAVITMLSAGCAARAQRAATIDAAEVRRDAMARARVWAPTNVSAKNMRTGPSGKGVFAPEALIDCDYVEKRMSGRTPKFICRLPNGEEVKVKYGRDNGEVFAEVAATRLLWALGFGADEVYPVRVRCHGCPEDAGHAGPPRSTRLFEVATVERQMRGHSLEDEQGGGWSWTELDRVDPSRGGASLAERDALKLLAVMLQHTDSKRDQQRIVCDGKPAPRCRHPFLMISDTGKTFGRANAFNRDGPGSVNLEGWAGTPIWAGDQGCRANLGRSMTGTLDDPLISDAGRKFLARLLARLSDRQLRDLFTVARFPLRGEAGRAEADREVDAWLRAFRDKAHQIAERSCTVRIAQRRAPASQAARANAVRRP